MDVDGTTIVFMRYFSRRPRYEKRYHSSTDASRLRLETLACDRNKLQQVEPGSAAKDWRHTRSVEGFAMFLQRGLKVVYHHKAVYTKIMIIHHLL